MNAINDLKDRFADLLRLNYITNLLGWDQQVYIPPSVDSTKGRSEQIALIQAISHKKLVSKKTGDLIKQVENIPNLNLVDSALLREAKRKYEKAVKIPVELVTEIAKTASLAHQAWEKAKSKSNFELFKPYLEKMVSLQRDYAEKINIGPTLYDSLLDIYEPGATSDWISKIFGSLKSKITDILNKINDSSDKPDQSILRKKYDSEKQWDFSIELLKALKFDFNMGRQDKSVHPFTTSISFRDTRITTRILENFLPTCIFGTIHECGHALYEMGFKDNLNETYLADGSSLGIHESQSRLWENIVGHSKEFWSYWYPILNNYFPENLKDYSKDEFYRSINAVKPSYIRV